MLPTICFMQGIILGMKEDAKMSIFAIALELAVNLVLSAPHHGPPGT